MFGKTIKLFTLFGFTVRIDVSWLVIMALVVWSLASGVFPARYEGLHWGIYTAMGLAAAVGLFLSITFHEMCHSLVARRYGMPMKGITLFLFGGLAEMRDEPPSAKAEFMMAIAGPLASVLVAGVFLGLMYLGQMLAWPDTFVGVFRWIGIINVVLVVFNLIPGFPLDGGRVLRAGLWHWKKDLREATHAASRVGKGFGAVLIGLGILYLLTVNPIGGLWWILIGLFIRGAAKSSYQQVVLRDHLKGEPVRRFMNTEPMTVSPSVPLDEFVESYVYEHHFKMFPVVEDGQLRGCVHTRQVKDVPRDQWSQKTVGDVASPCSNDNSIGPDADAVDAFSRMNRSGNSRILVAHDGQLEGILALKDLMKFLSLKLDMEGENASTARRIAQQGPVGSGKG